MSNDTELFELCKEVYARFPEWDNTELYYAKSVFAVDKEIELTRYRSQSEVAGYADKLHLWSHGDIEVGVFEWTVPLYTSDYLLEKIQPEKLSTHRVYLQATHHGFSAHRQDMVSSSVEVENTEFFSSDTPLKALLKLTLALNKAGEL